MRLYVERAKEGNESALLLCREFLQELATNCPDDCLAEVAEAIIDHYLKKLEAITDSN